MKKSVMIPAMILCFALSGCTQALPPETNLPPQTTAEPTTVATTVPTTVPIITGWVF